MENAPDLEWDENKRQDTLTKRGVDFADFALMDFATAKTPAMTMCALSPMA